MADEADLNALSNAPQENEGQQILPKNDLATLDAIIDARANETHCKIELHIDFDTEIEPIWLAPLTQRPKELHELNFTKVTDNFEKVELEFD